MRSTRGAGTACSPAGSRATGTPHAVGDRVIGARGAGAPSAAACGALARGTCSAARRFEASSQLSTHHPRLATLATHHPQLGTLTYGFSNRSLSPVFYSRKPGKKNSNVEQCGPISFSVRDLAQHRPLLDAHEVVESSC